MSAVYPVLDPRSIQEYIEADIEVIENKIRELELFGGNRDNIIMSLYNLSKYGYSVHKMTYYQMCMALHEIYWYRREEHKEYFELMDRIDRGETNGGM